MGTCGKCNNICKYVVSEIPSVISGMWKVIMLCNELFVKTLKSHEGSQRVIKGNVKGHPTICSKYNLITHRADFWEPSFWLGLGLEKAWEYYDEPWLLHSVECVYFFGGASVVDCNVLLLGLVVVNGVYMDGASTYNNNIRANTLSCICFWCSWTILVALAMYVVELTHFLMNYFVCNCTNLVECVLLD